MDRFDEALKVLESDMRREDPALDRALRTGRPRPLLRPWAVLLLAAAVAVLLGGLFAGHGLVLATGLVAAGIAAHLLDRPRGAGPVRPAGAPRRPRDTGCPDARP